MERVVSSGNVRPVAVLTVVVVREVLCVVGMGVVVGTFCSKLLEISVSLSNTQKMLLRMMSRVWRLSQAPAPASGCVAKKSRTSSYKNSLSKVSHTVLTVLPSSISRMLNLKNGRKFILKTFKKMSS